MNKYTPAKMGDPILNIVLQNRQDLIDQLSACLKAGSDVNYETAYNETALRYASRNGRWDAIRFY